MFLVQPEFHKDGEGRALSDVDGVTGRQAHLRIGDDFLPEGTVTPTHTPAKQPD
jgi:hypothetical protein